MTTASINSNAKKIERRPRIQARIAELKRGESPESQESSASAHPAAPNPEASDGIALRVKQERFLQLFLEKGNASEAYRLAYDVGPDTKPESIHRSAAELLANPKITSRIEAIRAELRERSAITLDRLVEALRPIAFSDIRKVVTWGAAIPLKDPETSEIVVVQDIVVRDDLDDAAAAMIAKIVRGRDGSLRVELHDKLAAIEKIARLLGLMKDQHEVKVEDITPRPQMDRAEWDETASKFFAAARDYRARVEAEAAALPAPDEARPKRNGREH
jgi:phage terminase small subunit